MKVGTIARKRGNKRVKNGVAVARKSKIQWQDPMARPLKRTKQLNSMDLRRQNRKDCSSRIKRNLLRMRLYDYYQRVKRWKVYDDKLLKIRKKVEEG